MISITKFGLRTSYVGILKSTFKDTVMLGIGKRFTEPTGCWTKPACLHSVHGHGIFMLWYRLLSQRCQYIDLKSTHLSFTVCQNSFMQRLLKGHSYQVFMTRPWLLKNCIVHTVKASWKSDSFAGLSRIPSSQVNPWCRCLKLVLRFRKYSSKMRGFKTYIANVLTSSSAELSFKNIVIALVVDL
jgi:hypothetical protein